MIKSYTLNQLREKAFGLAERFPQESDMIIKFINDLEREEEKKQCRYCGSEEKLNKNGYCSKLCERKDSVRYNY